MTQATWAFASIKALLSAPDFKYSLQDDLESFYYIILYASILWLPHKELETKDTEYRMKRFFGDYHEQNGHMTGGRSKFHNQSYGTFSKQWKFYNKALNSWLKYVLALQKPENVENWTPMALHNIWKDIDENDLPLDDRVDNLTQNTKRGKKKAVPKQEISEATRPSVRISQQESHSRSAEVRPRAYETRSSSKHQLADSVEVQVLKRAKNPGSK